MLEFFMQRETYTNAEVSQILGLGRDYTRRLIQSGKLPNVGNAKRIRVPKAAVQRYLEAGGTNSGVQS
jgi:excisionase family DNA binding protein